VSQGQTVHFGTGFVGGGERVGSGQVSTLSAGEAVRVNEHI
jgi:hypothetical protein